MERRGEIPNQENHNPPATSRTNSPKMFHKRLGKAMKRLKQVLPKSPSKQQYVVRALAESMSIPEKEKSKVKVGLSQETVTKVHVFY